MTPPVMKKYSIGKIDWFLAEERLQSVVGEFSHPEKERRHYGIYDYQGGKVFIKSFLEKGLISRIRHLFSPRGKTEFRIGRLLASRSISTPKVFGYGIGKNTSSVVEEYVEGESLLDAIKNTIERERIFILLTELLQQLKVHHIRHNDLHLDNVLIRGDRLYLIDLHKTKVKNTFNDADEMSNITHALGIIYDDISDKEREFFFTQYGCNPTIRQGVEREIAHLKKDWVSSKKKRAFKDTSLLNTSDGKIYIRGVGEMIKGVLVATLKEDKKVVVERFCDHIRKTYRDRRRLKIAWENHVVLSYLGSSSVPQAFYVKLPTLFSKGYVAMDDLGHRGIELDRFLDGKYNDMGFLERKKFLDGFSRFLQSIFRQRIIHRDMKGCNVFVLHDSGFIILDIEDFLFEEIREETLKRMFVQLNTTIPVRIVLKDRIRFFLMVVSSFKMNKKRLFRDIVKESLEREIVYEGTDGLKTEQW
jgi:tRNA A-37 threonylcarbamoyl transferase component Bud32